MGIRHSNVRASLTGERVNSTGRPRGNRTDGGESIDLDGVPTRYTKKSDVELPPAFWEEFRADPAAAIAKWTA